MRDDAFQEMIHQSLFSPIRSGKHQAHGKKSLPVALALLLCESGEPAHLGKDACCLDRLDAQVLSQVSFWIVPAASSYCRRSRAMLRKLCGTND